ncbi:MAG: DUF3989 domain-containing protein [Paludibacter sp.]|nr:DUF3989 domain-containing protein [Paludibacter sp.]
MKRKIYKIQSRIEEKLQNYCASLSPKRRLLSIVIVSAVFGIVSLYMAISGFYNINRTDNEQIKIQHINELQLHARDSIYQLNLKQNEEN